MLKDIKEYVNGIDFKMLSLDELAAYTKILIMIEQAESSVHEKEKIIALIQEAKSKIQ